MNCSRLNRVDYTQSTKSIWSKNFEWLESEFLMRAFSNQFPLRKFPITGKITGNFFSPLKKNRMDCGFSRF